MPVPDKPTEADVKKILEGMDREKLEKTLLTSFLYVKCLPEEKTAWMKAAKGRTVQNWVREALNKASGFSQ